MKRPISPSYTFNPGGATLDLSGVAGFALGHLFAVINLRLGTLVYAPTPGYGATANGTVLALQAPMTGHAAADPLMILYDDGGKPAEDASLQALGTALQQGLQNEQAALGALGANATWQAAQLAATQAITAALKAQVDASGLFVSDGTGTYVRRESINEGTGAITVAFENMDGSAASPNVAALAPITSKSRVATPVYYDVLVATAAYALTDTLAEVVITDTVTGGITATWQNLTKATTLPGAPPSTNVSRSSSAVSLPTGQKTAANSLSVVLSSDGPFASTVGTPADPAAADDVSAWSLMALVKRSLGRWKTLLGRLPASLGRTTAAASLPVVLASDQPALPSPSSVRQAGTLSAPNDAVTVVVDGMNTAVVQLASGSWSGGPAIFEASADGGATWTAVNMLLYAGSAPAGSTAVGGLWEMACGGLTHLRVRAAAAIAGGPVAAVVAATNGLKSIRVGNPAANPLTVTTGRAAAAGDAAVAAGGTAQTLFAGVTPANGWKVANPDPAEDLWVSDSGTAAPNGQGSYRVPAGGILTSEPGEKPCGPVSVYGASAGHPITARAW